MISNTHIKYLMILLLFMGVACWPNVGKSSTYELLFCAEQGVYALSRASDGQVSPHKILDLPEGSTCPVWSPDGKLALLYRFRETGPVIEDSLSLIEQQSGAIHEIYRFGPRDTEWAIRWLPDGISLLLNSARDYQGTGICNSFLTDRTINGTDCWNGFADIYKVDIHLHGAPIRFERLTASPSPRCDLAWSPDGRTVAYTHGGCGGSASEPASINVLDLETHGLTKLVDGTTDAGRQVNASPHWAPSGKKISFTSLLMYEGGKLFLADVKSLDMRQIASENAWGGYWSPDSQKIAWWRNSDGTFGLTNTESGNSQEWRSSKETEYYSGSYGWSPDSQHFVWSERAIYGDEKAFRMVDLTSGKIDTITTLLIDSFAWSPDSAWLAFSVHTPIDRDKCKFQNDIYIVKSDGTGLHSITEGQQLSALECSPGGWRGYHKILGDVQWVPK